MKPLIYAFISTDNCNHGQKLSAKARVTGHYCHFTRFPIETIVNIAFNSGKYYQMNKIFQSFRWNIRCICGFIIKYNFHLANFNKILGFATWLIDSWPFCFQTTRAVTSKMNKIVLLAVENIQSNLYKPSFKNGVNSDTSARACFIQYEPCKMHRFE